ncbi:kinase-like domain-containing protein [Podospora conica]|nr:kinase-like domain-containing protein [Schizothecium conicum]
MSTGSRSWSCDLKLPSARRNTSTELRNRTTELFRSGSSELRDRLSVDFILSSRSRGASADLTSAEPISGSIQGGDEKSSKSERDDGSDSRLAFKCPEESECDDDSDSETQTLEEVLGDTIVIDRGDSLRAAQLADEAETTPEKTLGVNDSGLDSTDLQSLLEEAMVQTADGRSKFLPCDKLDSLLSERNVSCTLLAECPDLSISTLAQILKAIRHGVSPDQALKKIFAIVTLLGMPGEVVHFLPARIFDSDLPLSEKGFQKAAFQWTKGIRHLGSLHVETENFLETQWRVLVPFFTTSSGTSHPGPRHYIFDDKVILPFVADDSIKNERIQGGFGEVRQVKIHPGHYNFGSQVPETTQTFAIKEIRAPEHSMANDRAFSQELEALKRANHLKSPHVVKLLASFQQRGSYFLLFPWADGTLRQFWANAPNEQGQSRPPHQLIHWSVKQLVGLTSSLQGIHDGPSGHRGATQTERGMHGDIKPDNILWYTDWPDDRGVLVISDFGLSRLHTEQSQKRRRLQGTATYRAPECDFTGMPITPAYDVWSLGCLVLEFLTWLMLGNEALNYQFPRARSAGLLLLQHSRAVGIDDDAFFTLVADSKGQLVRAELKPSVRNYILRLRADPGCSGPLRSILDLVEFGMLVPDASRRLDASTCVRYLREISRQMDYDMESVYFPGRASSPKLPKMLPPSGGLNSAGKDVDITQGTLVQPCLQQLEFTLSGPFQASHQLFSLESIRSWLDRYVGTKSFDLWPLPLAKSSLSARYRLTWTYGGQQMSILLGKRTARRWRRGLTTAPASGILPSWKPSASTQSASTRSSQSHSPAPGLLSTWIKWTRKPTTAANNPKPPPPLGTGCWKESYLCVDRPWSSVTETNLTTLVVGDSMNEDYDLFIKAREILSRAQGNRIQRFFSWRSYTHVSLSQFHFLFNNSDLVKAYRYTPAISTPQRPTDICKGYEYIAQHPEVDTHMEIMAEIILHGIRNPKLGRGERSVIDGIPKLKSPPGLKKEALNSGWGFHAGQGPCVAKMGVWFSAFVALGLAFVPVWLASIDEVDLQNAFAPVSFLLTFLGVMFALGCLVQGPAG